MKRYWYLLQPEIPALDGEVFDDIPDLLATLKMMTIGTSLPPDQTIINDINSGVKVTYNGIGTIQRSKFYFGEEVVDFNANRYIVGEYWYNTFVDDFNIRLDPTSGGQGSFFAPDSDYVSWHEEVTDPEKEELSQHKGCSYNNPECNIVESYTGLGANMGDKFYYCRTHKEEVHTINATKPNINPHLKDGRRF